MPKWWRRVTIGVLGLTALAKLLSLIHPTRLLFQPDAIFMVPMMYVVLAAAIIELGICLFLWRGRNDPQKAFAVLVFAALILSYRAGLHVNGVHFCPCLGNVASWWPWLGSHESPVLVTIALWLLLTSLIQLGRGASLSWLPGTDPAFSWLRIAIPIGSICLLCLWMAPWSLVSHNAKEGVEFSKMLLFLHHPKLAPGFWNDPAWSYAHVFASIFSMTGFHFWIPRVATLIILGAAWMTLPRLLPRESRWPHLLFSIVLFCSWPYMLYTSTLATPVLPAMGLAIISAGILPRPEDEWHWWRLAAAGLLLALAAWMNVAGFIVLPAIAVTLLWRRKRSFGDPFGDPYAGGTPGKPTASNEWPTANAWKMIAMAGLCWLVVRSVSFGAQVSINPPTPTGPSKAALYLSDLINVLGSPGTILSALVGAIIIWRQRYILELLFSMTLLATVLVVHLLLPHWADYQLYLAAPAAVLGGYGMGALWRGCIGKTWILSKSNRAIFNADAYLILGPLVVSLWIGFESSNAPRDLAVGRRNSLFAGAVGEVLADYRGRVKWVYTRDNSAAVNAGFVLPPELTDLSGEPPRADTVKGRPILDIAKEYQCEILVLQSNGELRQEDWLKFAQEKYMNIWAGATETVYVTRNLNPRQEPNPARQFGKL
jgi:hypothetical protein